MTRGWLPLLEGSRRDRALEAIDAIGRDLRKTLNKCDAPWELATSALFFAYRAASAFGEFGNADTADELIDRASEALEASPGDAALHGGFTGVAWLVEHVTALLHPGDPNDLCASVDEALADLVPGWTGTFDLMRGLIGMGVYALERGPRGRPCLDAIVSRMREWGEARGEGTAWRTRPEWLIPSMRERSPHGHWDLGMAHGTPGALSFLARATAEGKVDAGDLLERAATWTLASVRSQPLPKWFSDGKATVAQPAWCYGAPGVAAALAIGGCGAGRPAWKRAALELAHAAIAAPNDESIIDTGLCHGAAGIAHVYQRIHAVTRDAACAAESLRWFDVSLARRGPRGIGGFEAFVRPNYSLPNREWFADPSFLTGATGVGLALLAGCDTREPLWDRLLLLAPPAESVE